MNKKEKEAEKENERLYAKKSDAKRVWYKEVYLNTNKHNVSLLSFFLLCYKNLMITF